MAAIKRALCCAWLAACINGKLAASSFTIEDDIFKLDGETLQIVSGSFHYFRIHPAYWEDRLLRAKALGLNTIQTYILWSLHEPTPGAYKWDGAADIDAFLAIARRLDLHVILRPGPYICAEVDWGGLPWWLGSPQVRGGGKMKLRSEDPEFLGHVNRWWSALLPKIAPYTHARGGPILMVQIENEYGFCGASKVYLRALAATARQALGDDIMLFTTDPPQLVERGSLPGDEVFTVVDFGPATDPESAFAVQRSMNPTGKSAPFCSEFYTGWITHWGEPMANTSAAQLAEAMSRLLQYANGTGSVNLYVAHGGSNWGFSAGAGSNGDDYLAQITSYDYCAPISEAGRTGQPGIGGPSKFQLLRDVIANHTGLTPPDLPAGPAASAYGKVEMAEGPTLLEAAEKLWDGDGIPSLQPLSMEAYNHPHGFILYTKELELGDLQHEVRLDLGQRPHDYAQVLLDGVVVANLNRTHTAKGGPPTVQLPGSQGDRVCLLQILVHAMGRNSGGCEYDFKGLVSTNVTLNGKPLTGWRVFPLALDNTKVLSSAEFARRRLALNGFDGGPRFYRGSFTVEDNMQSHPPDTFIHLPQWSKGLLWVNGVNLGWYWPRVGPQNTAYIPGPMLSPGTNDILMLEVEQSPLELIVELLEEPDFRGPSSRHRQTANALL